MHRVCFSIEFYKFARIRMPKCSISWIISSNMMHSDPRMKPQLEIW